MPRRSESGQATLELALCLPLVAVILGALVEVGGVAVDQLRVWHAVREAARVAIVDPSAGAIRQAATRGGLAPLDIEVAPAMHDRVQGEPLTVRVSYPSTATVPVIGSLLRRGALEAEATMRIERP